MPRKLSFPPISTVEISAVAVVTVRIAPTGARPDAIEGRADQIASRVERRDLCRIAAAKKTEGIDEVGRVSEVNPQEDRPVGTCTCHQTRSSESNRARGNQRIECPRIHRR